MARAARNKALREAMLASGKSPLFTALVVWKRENEGKQIENWVYSPKLCVPTRTLTHKGDILNINIEEGKLK